MLEIDVDWKLKDHKMFRGLHDTSNSKNDCPWDSRIQKNSQEWVINHIYSTWLRARWCMICLSCRLELCGQQFLFFGGVFAEFLAPRPWNCSTFLEHWVNLLITSVFPVPEFKLPDGWKAYQSGQTRTKIKQHILGIFCQ